MDSHLTSWSERSHDLARLLARTGLGDRAAFASLYQCTAGHLLAVVLRIQRDRALAEDILQEVFVNVWRAARSFDPAQAQPLTWLTSLARHRAIDGLRRQQARPREQGPGQGLGPGDGIDDDIDPYQGVMADEADGPLELLRRATEARALGSCMEALNASQRQCVALAFYDGLSHAEVAQRLSQPLGTVKSWVRRGLLALKGCLQGAVDREPA